MRNHKSTSYQSRLKKAQTVRWGALRSEAPAASENDKIVESVLIRENPWGKVFSLCVCNKWQIRIRDWPETALQFCVAVLPFAQEPAVDNPVRADRSSPRR
jgi:hypothetical protein